MLLLLSEQILYFAARVGAVRSIVVLKHVLYGRCLYILIIRRPQLLPTEESKRIRLKTCIRTCILKVPIAKVLHVDFKDFLMFWLFLCPVDEVIKCFILAYISANHHIQSEMSNSVSKLSDQISFICAASRANDAFWLEHARFPVVFPQPKEDKNGICQWILLRIFLFPRCRGPPITGVHVSTQVREGVK